MLFYHNIKKAREWVISSSRIILATYLFGGGTTGHTDSSSLATSGLGVLTAHLVSPVMSDTAMGSDLLQALQILTHLSDQAVDHNLRGLTGHSVLLSVDKPVGDLVLLVVGNDGAQQLDLLVGEGTRAAVDINLSLLADKVGVSAANTGDLGKGEHHLLLTIDVGVQHTQDVLELGGHLKALYNTITIQLISTWKQQ